MDKKRQIEIRSNEVQEILGGVPSRLVRYGIVSILAVFLLLILATFVIKYPDVIRSKIVVTTERPPANIVSRSTGKLEELFVENNQKVVKGTILGIIENPGLYDDFIYLNNQLERLRKYMLDITAIDTVILRTDLQLGEVQDEYSNMVRKINDYRVFKEVDYFPKLNKSLEEEKHMSRIYYDRLYIQRNTFETEFNLAKTQFNRDSSLFINNVLPAKDYENSKAALLAKKNNFEGAKTKLAETQMEIFSLDQRMIENRKNQADQKSGYELEINQAYQNLVAAVNEWELKYVLTAPVDGVVAFNSFWSETQNVKEGDRVMTIIPEDPGELIGKVELPIRGSGKIKEDLNVNIKFDNYPYMEYGIVKGKVKSISGVPEDNFYTVEVTFPNGLVTTYGETLDLQNEISGNAEIVAEDLRLIQRIFNPLKALWGERIISKK
ncbi:MAG: HlyD family efflux transporter periplasmic adaptor subunit [Prolixibacteraceae bacterium]|nr:HlyD family efflux transporter periplasmic adaptor subunit [Prolixibacteraceae bacterium]MBN2775066.1 HlyD family efflux transporter periplasmic adaptor subunit [Prolixibacteraceae bacterium]